MKNLSNEKSIFITINFFIKTKYILIQSTLTKDNF